ncbi:LPXTG cell wall anchor domain-containing protein, partial [Staphylococcus lugdunensis]|uniref:LPXTG cell wall anchor domain-containing protein n=1 Tax=Staphylococcus lugdunensis TaxID=28035 RepID=UPI002554752D
GKPSEPGKPNEPSKPSEPNKPSEPSEPNKPNEPTKPSEPNKPSEPGKPSKPNKSVHTRTMKHVNYKTTSHLQQVHDTTQSNNDKKQQELPATGAVDDNGYQAPFFGSLFAISGTILFLARRRKHHQ